MFLIVVFVISIVYGLLRRSNILIFEIIKFLKEFVLAKVEGIWKILFL